MTERVTAGDSNSADDTIEPSVLDADVDVARHDVTTEIPRATLTAGE